MKVRLVHDIEAERALLGAAMMEGGEAAAEICELLSETDFYRASHRTVFSAISSLVEEGASVDAITVKNRLQARGQLENEVRRCYLLDLCGEYRVFDGWRSHARIVRELSAQRTVTRAAVVVASLSAQPRESPEGWLEEAMSTMRDAFLEAKRKTKPQACE